MRRVITRLTSFIGLALMPTSIMGWFALAALDQVDTPGKLVQVLVAGPAGRTLVAGRLAQLAGVPGSQTQIAQALADPGAAHALAAYADARTDAERSAALAGALAPVKAANPALAATMTTRVERYQHAQPGSNPIGETLSAASTQDGHGSQSALGHPLQQVRATGTLWLGRVALACAALLGVSLVVGPGRSRMVRRAGLTLLGPGITALATLAWLPAGFVLWRCATVGTVGLVLVAMVTGLLDPVGRHVEIPSATRQHARRRHRQQARRARRHVDLPAPPSDLPEPAHLSDPPDPTDAADWPDWPDAPHQDRRGAAAR